MMTPDMADPAPKPPLESIVQVPDGSLPVPASSMGQLDKVIAPQCFRINGLWVARERLYIGIGTVSFFGIW